MKKLRLFLMTMLLSAMSVNMSAQVAGDKFTKTLEDGVTQATFRVDNPTLVSLICCTTTSNEVTIPRNIMNGDKTFRIREISYISNEPQWSSCIKKINLPEGVEILNWACFSGAQIETIDIPASVTTISPEALTNNSLKEITVRNGNTAYEAIDGILYTTGPNKSLVVVPRGIQLYNGVLTIAEGTKTIELRAISNISQIKKIVFPSTMTSICETPTTYFSIETCNNVAEVEVAEGNDAMYVEDNVVFANDENNTLLYFPPARVNDTNSEGKTFYTVPNGVKTIGPFACRSAKFNIFNLNEVETIEKQAFTSCNYMTGISLSHNLSAISDGALRSGTIQNFYIDGELTGISDYFSVQDGVLFSSDKTMLIQFPLGRSGEYVIPEGTTTKIADYAFTGSKLTNLTIPGSVTTIGNYAFANMNYIIRIHVPEGVTNIQSYAFSSSSKLQEVFLPSSLKNLPVYCFASCPELRNISFSEGLEEIGSHCFYSCSLTEVTLPKSLKSLGARSFRNCTSLEKLSFVDNSQLISIGEYSFLRCNSLKEIDFGSNSSLTTIGTAALADLPALEKVTIPASVTKINARAFANTPSLTTVIFEEGSQQKIIGAGSFAECGLRSFEIPDAVTTIEREAFRNCNVLEEITLSKNISSISAEAFKYCTKLKAINVPADNAKYSSIDGMLLSKDKKTLVLFPPGKANDTFTLLAPSIEKIGDYAFYYCENLKNVTIPNKVTEIGNRAFGFCPELNTITFLCDEMIAPAKIAQATNTMAFDDGTNGEGVTNMYENITIYVRAEKYDEYAGNAFYQKFLGGIKTSFIGDDGAEYIAVSDNAVDMLSLPNVHPDTYTFIMPRKVNTPEGTEMRVSLIGDYLFEHVEQPIEELVVFDNVQYIGAKAFVSNHDAAGNPKVKNLFFIESEPTNQMLSTTRFKLNETGSDYSEIPADTKIFVKKSAVDKYKTEWPNYVSNIDYKIPLPAITTNYGTFSREFAVDLDDINPDKEHPNVIAFTAKQANYDEAKNITHVTMVSINNDGSNIKGYSGEGDGTYIPANTGVLLKAYNGSTGDNDYYQIAEEQTDNDGTNNLMASVTERINQKISSDDGDYKNFYVSGGTFKSFTGDLTFTVHKSYLHLPKAVLPNGAKLAFSFVDSDGNASTTGIESINVNENVNDNLYNLQGQRVNKAGKGIYIKNGKKILK